MRRNFLWAVAVTLPSLMFCSGSARGDEASSYYAGTSEGRYLSVADSKTVTNDAAAANTGCGCATSCGCNAGCDDCCDDCCDDLDAFCEDCPRSTSIWFTNFESWRGVSDTDFQNNDGIRTGFNYGALAGDSRVGFQFGASYGAYDLMGRSTVEPDSVQEQYFFTTGFFVHADCDSPWSGGIVYDMMVNDNFGILANEPYLTQWRGQIGYATSAWNEFGVWGTARDRGDSQGGAIFRPVQQYNGFWHHKWACSVDSYIWTGILDTSDDISTGSGLGEFTVGGAIVAPISDSWAITGDLQYLKPSASSGPAGSSENSFFVSVGLSYYPRCNARTRTVAGSCSAPVLGVANNGSFLVDSNL